MIEYEQKIYNIINNAEEDVIFQAHQAYKQGYEDGKADTPFTDTKEAEDKAYNRGLNDAWDAARKIHDGQIPYEVFGLDKTGNGFTYASPLNWEEDITAKEAIAKIKEYEDKQKQDAEIKVGDEVIVDDDVRAVVIGKSYGLYLAIASDFSLHEAKEFEKTGRRFPEMAEIFAEMRGES